MRTLFSQLAVLASISGVSTGLYIAFGLAIVGGIVLLWKAPHPFNGLGIGLLAGTVVVAVVILTGPMK